MNYEEVYGKLHADHEKYFAGFTLKRYADRITELVKLTTPRRLLDYGSGKGYQYLLRRYHLKWAPYMCGFDSELENDGVDAFEGNELPHCYDLGVRQLRERSCAKGPDCYTTCPMIQRKSKEPCQKLPIFDGVFSTDMLEHIERDDVPLILDDVLSFITPDDRPTFAFFSVSCIPADKFLPDGRNVHVTMEQPQWWMPVLTAAFERSKAPRLRMRVCFEASAKTLVDHEWVRK